MTDVSDHLYLPRRSVTRTALDEAIRDMWILFARIHDDMGDEFLTDHDHLVWSALANHPCLMDAMIRAGKHGH